MKKSIAVIAKRSKVVWYLQNQNKSKKRMLA